MLAGESSSSRLHTNILSRNTERKAHLPTSHHHFASCILHFKLCSMPFTSHSTPINDLLIIEPKIFWDARGRFAETYQTNQFEALWISTTFVQDNHSFSMKGVLRGLHFQTQHTQGKLVRVTHGSVYDVAVDLRENSPTFWQGYGILLSWENKLQLFVPRGFAHGFLTLEDNTEFLYKCDDIYTPAFDSGIHRASTAINRQTPSLKDIISQYGLGDYLIISEKDKVLGEFNQDIKYF